MQILYADGERHACCCQKQQNAGTLAESARVLPE